MAEPYYADEHVTLYHGDCRDILAEVGSVDIVVTDPPYSTGRSESEFAATGNIAVALHMASELAPVMAVFGTSSGRGIEFVRSSVRKLPHNRTLAWHRAYVNSPAAGPWRWDLVLIHVFGRGSFGRPESSSLIQTDGTKSLALETGHRSPVPVRVMGWISASRSRSGTARSSRVVSRREPSTSTRSAMRPRDRNADSNRGRGHQRTAADSRARDLGTT